MKKTLKGLLADRAEVQEMTHKYLKSFWSSLSSWQSAQFWLMYYEK